MIENMNMLQTLRNDFNSHSENTIIPLEDGAKFSIVPPSGGIFTTPITVEETKHKFLVWKFDYDDGNSATNMVEQYQQLISDETSFQNNDVLGEYNFEIEKDWVAELIAESSLEVDDFLIALTELLELFPTIPLRNSSKRKATLPEHLLQVLSVLVESGLDLDKILEIFVNLTILEFDRLILATDDEKVDIFRKRLRLDYIDYEEE